MGGSVDRRRRRLGAEPTRAAGADGAPAGGLVLGDDGLPIAPEENKAEEIIPEEILRDMENVWSVFDMN